MCHLFTFSEEINLLAETIPCGVGDTPQKRKYKYSLLNLLSQMEAMAVPLTSIYNLKTYIFSIYVMLGDRDTAVIWCRELARYLHLDNTKQTSLSSCDIHIFIVYIRAHCRLSSTLSGEGSEETQGWRDTSDWIHGYFADLGQLQAVVQGWSLVIQ